MMAKTGRNLIGIAVTCVAVAATLGAQAPGAGDSQASAAAGRKAFAELGAVPWYDAQQDALRPITLRADPKPRQGSFDVSGLATPLQWFAWTMLAVLLGLLVFWMIRAALHRDFRPESRVTVDDQLQGADRVEALEFMKERSQSDLLGAARRHYELGNFSEAIIYLFSYELVELDKSSLIHLAKGKTNRQYLREAGRSGAMQGLLERTTTAFEDVFFGRRTLDRTRFEACWNQLPEFTNLVAQADS